MEEKYTLCGTHNMDNELHSQHHRAEQNTHHYGGVMLKASLETNYEVSCLGE